jgi:hypothetical protein
MERFATTDIYARYAPDYGSAAVRAIDEFFWELSPLLARPLLGVRLEDQPTPNDLRAHCVPSCQPWFRKSWFHGWGEAICTCDTYVVWPAPGCSRVAGHDLASQRDGSGLVPADPCPRRTGSPVM